MTHDTARLMHAEHLYAGTPLPAVSDPPLTVLQIVRAPFVLLCLPFVYAWIVLKG